MTYKLKTPLQPSGKMQVTPDQSEALQKALFEMGYSWNEIKKVKLKGKRFLIWTEFELLGKLISWDDQEYFNEHDNPIHLFENHFETINL